MPSKKKSHKFSDLVPFMLVTGVFCAISVYLLTSFFMTLRGYTYEASVLLAAKPATSEAHAAPKGFVFKDVPYTHENGTAILYFRDANIIAGYSDGTFKPDNDVNRAEFLKVLISALGEEASGSNCFTDIKNEWFAPYVCYAKTHGWVSGYGDGSFKPAQAVNKAEAVKITTVAFGYEIPSTIDEAPFTDTPLGQWYTPYISLALSHDLLQEAGQSKYGPSNPMKRAGTIELVYRAMKDSGMLKGTI